MMIIMVVLYKLYIEQMALQFFLFFFLNDTVLFVNDYTIQLLFITV